MGYIVSLMFYRYATNNFDLCSQNYPRQTICFISISFFLYVSDQTISITVTRFLITFKNQCSIVNKVFFISIMNYYISVLLWMISQIWFNILGSILVLATALSEFHDGFFKSYISAIFYAFGMVWWGLFPFFLKYSTTFRINCLQPYEILFILK